MEMTYDSEADVFAGFRGKQSDHQFDPLFCARFHNLADIWRRSSGHGQYTTQICKYPESGLNVCKERSHAVQAGPRLLKRTVADRGNFQQSLRSIKLGLNHAFVRSDIQCMKQPNSIESTSQMINVGGLIGAIGKGSVNAGELTFLGAFGISEGPYTPKARIRTGGCPVHESDSLIKSPPADFAFKITVTVKTLPVNFGDLALALQD
jgi:hypothetical protein